MNFAPGSYATFTLLIALTLVFQVGAVFFFRGRRVGSDRRCGRCDYDLRWLPQGASKCPECGSDLAAQRAIVIGCRVRRWRPFFLMQSAALLLASVVALRGVAQAREFDWLPYEPLAWVLADAKPPLRSARAVHELFVRTAHGKLSDAQIGPVVAAALAEQAGTGTWDNQWGRMIEALHNTGRLPDTDWNRYVAAIASYDLKLPPLVRAGAGVPLNLAVEISDRRGALKGEGKVNIGSISIDGKTVSSKMLSSANYSFEAHSWGRGATMVPLPKIKTLGRHTIAVVIEVDESVNLGPAAAIRPSDVRRVSKTLSGTFIVCEPEVIPAAQEAAAKAAMESGITAGTSSGKNAQNLFINFGPLPYTICARLSLLRRDGSVVMLRESDGDFPFEHSLTIERMKSLNWSIGLPRECPLDVDFVLTPDPKAAANLPDPAPAWPLAIVVHTAIPATQSAVIK